jgi:hypothetical protein
VGLSPSAIPFNAMTFRHAMRLVLKSVVGIVVLLVLVAGGVIGSFDINAATPMHPVGFAQVTVQDPDDKPLQVGIRYPTDSHAGSSLIGLSMQKVAGNGTVVGRGLPLIVMSHGNFGSCPATRIPHWRLLHRGSWWQLSRMPATTPRIKATSERSVG